MKRDLEKAGRRLGRANRRMIESQFGRAEAIAWAREHEADRGRWPARRFRVEGGLSRLLGEAAARRTALRYGGLVVELIPRKKLLAVDEEVRA